MNKSQLNSYRKRLLEESDLVSNEIENHSEIGHLEVDTAIVGSEDKLLQKIELALKRIEDGTYGPCMECGGEIAAARLDAKPSVSLCTACQEKKEQG